MQGEVSKRRIKVCILSAALIQMCFVGLAAAIADIAAFFPEYSVQVIQTGVNAINLMGIFGALLAGFLSYGHSKKILVLVGLALVAIGGGGGFFLHDTIVLFYMWSLIIGAGMGLFTPPATSLMVDYFEGTERNQLTGVQTAFINGGGVILTFLGGILAAIAWHVSYLAFLLAVPVLIICALNMPAKNKYQAEKTEKLKIPKSVYYYVMTTFMTLLVYNAFPSNMALFLSEKNLGDASIAGGVGAVFMLGGVVLGLIFSKLSVRIGEYLFALSHVMLLITFIIMCTTNSLIAVFIAAFIGGTSISMTLPQSLFSVASKIPPAITPAVFSLVASVSTSVATFISPTVMALLSGLVSDAGDSVSRFTTAGILCLIFAVVQFIMTFRSRKIAA